MSMSIHGLLPKPADATWTDEQWSAITARGNHLLVAAAAGSGKTAVLVERLIRMVGDESNPIDVDRLLVATFTKAASEEMRHRIREALEKKLATVGESEHIARQLALLPRASITTLHSFCMEIVRRNFVEVGLDPNFRIGNEIEIGILQNDVLEQVLERYYAEENEVFFRFIDTFTSDRSDARIFELVIGLYTFAQSNPWPAHWLREKLQPFQTAANGSHPIAQRLAVWTTVLLNSLQIELQACRADLQAAFSIAMEYPGLDPYVKRFADDLAMLDPLLEAAFNEDWQSCVEQFQTLQFERMPNTKKDECDEAMKDLASALRKGVKDSLENIQENWFGRSMEQHAEDVAFTLPVIEMFIELTLAFADAFAEAKREKGIVDFNDLEHYALAILRDKDSTPERMLPSAVALEYQERFAEVLLDEYQDTNQVQESIVQLLSKSDPGNRFMVGDVKQSIYRFRLAEPNLFLRKYGSFSSIHQQDELENAEGVRIDLARNFRSRRQVVDGINYLFRQLMQPLVAEIEYDEAAELKLGATYPDAAHACEIVLIADGESEKASNYGDSFEQEDSEVPADRHAEEQENLSKVQKEARFVATRIREMMEQGFHVYDGKAKQNRPLQYRDITVLLRSTKFSAPVFEEELKRAGVPSYAELNTGYFEAVEVETMLSLLQVVDNPNQDIALAAVLRSPIFGYSTEMLANVRLAAPKGSFYEALVAYAEENEQTAALLHQIERWRDAARSMPLSEFLSQVYRETGYYDGVGGWAGGMQRQANLRALIDRAKQFEASSYRGLFRFLRFIERLRESEADLGTAQAIGEQADVVRIMSIHKSKGLEFPVVFLAGVTKKFNEADMRSAFMLHRELGYGPKLIETVRRISYPTMAHQAIGERLRKELLAEEMRILYVALTRAKEKLIIVGTVAEHAKRIQQWTRYLNVSELGLPEAAMVKAKCYLDWLGPALIRHPHARIWREQVGAASKNIRNEDPSEWQLTLLDELPSVVAEQKQHVDEAYMQTLQAALPFAASEPINADLHRQLYWLDDQKAASTTFAKITVSELKRLTEEPTPGDELYPASTKVKMDRPAFMQKQQLTPTERGTAYHTVMQHLPLDAGPISVATVLDSLVDRQLLTSAQRQAVDTAHIAAFVQSSLYKELVEAEEVYRELPFSLGIPAGELYEALQGDSANQRVLMQGVIDCLFTVNGELTLLDYKTDRVTTPEEIGERYKKQLELYARAIEQMTGKRVVRRLLYLFDGGHIVET